ncbi:MAG: PHP domain-containing protein [Desulfomonilia bacterium]|nr:PHP domain-containing protein [Desulfomonilia bacterium]
MIIDLHIHTKEGSDGRWPLEQIFSEAARRGIGLLSITDHDSLEAQQKARALATHHDIAYLSGIELNVNFSHPSLLQGKGISLDFLGYGFDIFHAPLSSKLAALRDHRIKRAEMILENVNAELRNQGVQELTSEDFSEIQAQADGSLGRPHIANYLMKKGLVQDKKEAFDRYLVRCDVPKMPLGLEEASDLIRSAGGKLVLAHPNDVRGTSLVAATSSLRDQLRIIETMMIPFVDGVECWHPCHSRQSTKAYLDFARRRNLLATGGSDCHQQPVLMGSVAVTDWVAEQFFGGDIRFPLKPVHT